MFDFLNPAQTDFSPSFVSFQPPSRMSRMTRNKKERKKQPVTKSTGYITGLPTSRLSSDSLSSLKQTQEEEEEERERKKKRALSRKYELNRRLSSERAGCRGNGRRQVHKHWQMAASVAHLFHFSMERFLFFFALFFSDLICLFYFVFFLFFKGGD